MKSNRIRSVKVSQWVSLVSIVILAVLASFHSYTNSSLQSAEENHQHVLRIQNMFVDVLFLESAVLNEAEDYANLLARSQEVQIQIKQVPQLLDPLVLKEREYVFNKLLTNHVENENYYMNVNETLPELIDGVRNIHQYYIETLKERLDERSVVPVQNVRSDFKRSPEKAAPELEIIGSAVIVQNDLLDIVSLFSAMQQGSSPDNIATLFERRIEKFYASVNRFDDYTIDSQDGVLVEKLLITGREFTRSFGELLKNNKRERLLVKKLSSNQQATSKMFESSIAALKSSNASLKRRLKILQKASTVMLVWLACWLGFYGIRLSREFAGTVRETKKIQSDLKYRISYTDRCYSEFQIIYDTLNMLADTAENQVTSLEKMRGELTRRVQERTSELVHMNTRLKNEIADRVRADETRRELEGKLIRAKKMEAIGTLAGGVAHDLNNILSGVVSYPELILLDMKEDDPLYPSIITIKQSGEKAASIVQDLLTLARRGVAISEVVAFDQLLEEYLHSAEYRSLCNVHTGVEVVTQIVENCGNVKGSRLHLMKTVMNLMANAMEAMPEGGVLTLSASGVYVDTVLKGYDTVNEGDYVCLTVQDTGVGMTQEVSEQIFEPFFSKKKMGRSGTGLGMAVVYSTVKDHGGYIDIQSTPGEGTVIAVYLPLTREAETVVSGSFDITSLQGDGEHVLVVDDIYEQRQIASSMLRRLNYTVATATGGDEAVAYIKKNDVDVVVLDMIMPPGMDGLDTYLALKAIVPDIQVVIASGFSENERVMKAQELGAGMYIRKPYSLEVLGTAIRSALQAERMQS